MRTRQHSSTHLGYFVTQPLFSDVLVLTGAKRVQAVCSFLEPSLCRFQRLFQLVRPVAPIFGALPPLLDLARQFDLDLPFEPLVLLLKVEDSAAELLERSHLISCDSRVLCTPTRVITNQDIGSLLQHTH